MCSCNFRSNYFFLLMLISIQFVFIVRVLNVDAAQDFSLFKKFVGLSAFDKVENETILSNKLFQEYFKKSVGEDIHKKLMHSLKEGGRYFHSGDITENNGVIAVTIDDLSAGYECCVFVDINKKYIDVCWDDKNLFVCKMYFHDGRVVILPSGDWRDVPYEQLISGEFLTKVIEQRKNLLGKWSANLIVPIDGGREAKLSRIITITGDINKVETFLKFSQTEHLELVGDGRFSCSNKPFMDIVSSGDVSINSKDVNFYPDSVSDNKCGNTKSKCYRMMNGNLVEIYNDIQTRIVLVHQ